MKIWHPWRYRLAQVSRWMRDDPRDLAPLTPLQDAIDQIGTHGDGLEFDVLTDSQGHAGASLEASKYVGKGWSVGGAISWLKETGYAAVGKLTWRPKARARKNH